MRSHRNCFESSRKLSNLNATDFNRCVQTVFSFLGKTAFFQSVPAPCIRLVTLETLSELSPRPKTTTSQHPSALHDQSVAKKFTKGQGAMEYVVW